jgi:hypothetical protein
MIQPFKLFERTPNHQIQASEELGPAGGKPQQASPYRHLCHLESTKRANNFFISAPQRLSQPRDVLEPLP